MKDNNLMLGYESVPDLLSSIFGLKFSGANLIFSSAGAVTAFITTYIYDDAHAVYVLVGFIFLDAITGILRAIKQKKFSSSKLPRILVIMICYLTLLSLGWNLAQVHDIFSWVPGALYFGFITTLCISIMENLYELGVISEKIYLYIKKKITLIQEFFFGSDPTKKNKLK